MVYEINKYKAISVLITHCVTSIVAGNKLDGPSSNHIALKLHDKKQDFYQVLLYGCTTWTQIKRPKKLDNNTMMSWPVFNKSCKQPPQNSSCARSHLSSDKSSKWDEDLQGTSGEVSTNSKASVGWLSMTYIRLLCTDMGCSLQELPRGTGRYGRMVREGQWIPCYQYDLMIIIMCIQKC